MEGIYYDGDYKLDFDEVVEAHEQANLFWRARDVQSGRCVSEQWLQFLNAVCGSGEGLSLLEFGEVQSLRDFLQFVRGAFWILEHTDQVRIFDTLLGAKALRFDERNQVFLAWYGGHGIHAYDAVTGREVAFWNVGDFSRSDARRQVVVQSMDAHLREEVGYPWSECPF
jgi:hypothetical protein